MEAELPPAIAELGSSAEPRATLPWPKGNRLLAEPSKPRAHQQARGAAIRRRCFPACLGQDGICRRSPMRLSCSLLEDRAWTARYDRVDTPCCWRGGDAELVGASLPSYSISRSCHLIPRATTSYAPSRQRRAHDYPVITVASEDRLLDISGSGLVLLNRRVPSGKCDAAGGDLIRGSSNCTCCINWSPRRQERSAGLRHKAWRHMNLRESCESEKKFVEKSGNFDSGVSPLVSHAPGRSGREITRIAPRVLDASIYPEGGL